MTKRITILISFLLILNILLGQNIIEEKIYFDHNKYNLTDSSTKKLNLLLDKIKELNLTEVKLTGHTDSDGNNSYNENLSKKRVSAVSSYIISKGIKSDLVQIDYKGEVNPVTTNDNDNSKQKNRRVEILVKYILPAVTVNKITPDTSKSKPDDNNSTSQTFTVSASKDIVIQGKKGTKITIWKNTLVDRRGVIIRDVVVIELKEILSKSDMILNGVQTVSDGKLLETDGMIYLKVT